MSEAQNPPVLLDNLEALLDAMAPASLEPVAVEVPELGGTVYVRRVDTDEWLDPDASGQPPKDATARQRRGWAVARWLCNAQGQRIVKPDNLQILERFAALPYQAAHRILSTAGVVDGAAEKNA